MSRLPDSLKHIEALVASAKNYVKPSDNLRPRVMDAARSRRRIVMNSRRILQLSFIVMLGVLMTIPVQQRLEVWRQNAFTPSTDELQQQAQAYAERSSVGQNWGMVEAYKNLKQQQRAKFTGSVASPQH